MAQSLNRVTLIGHLGKEPEIRTTQQGNRVASFSLATSESWKDQSGERQERTTWHRVVIFNENLIGIIEKYAKKGSKVYLEGQLENRKWTGDDGKENTTTEIVLRQYRGEILLLDGKPDGQESAPPSSVNDVPEF
jgi:single-strand DNA-binding protein